LTPPCMAQSISIIPSTIDDLLRESWAVNAHHHPMPLPELEAAAQSKPVNMLSSRLLSCST
jgi:hypothetical protein